MNTPSAAPGPTLAEKVQQEAREAARYYPDLDAACPYPFNSEQGRIFRAAFTEARRAAPATATPGPAA